MSPAWATRKADKAFTNNTGNVTEQLMDIVMTLGDSWGEHDSEIRAHRWTVVNAPRPLRGDLTWRGDGPRGVFFAAGARDRYGQLWQTAHASELQLATEDELRQLLREAVQRDGYELDEIEADPAAFGLTSLAELAASYGLPWDGQDCC